MKWLAADFETSNSDKNIEEGYTRVWAWDIFNPENRSHVTGYEIDTFFDYIFTLQSTLLYFHNLKFDGAFVINYLLQHGFEIKDTKEHKTISTLITDRLVWYTFTIYFNGKKYIFRDSNKKITTSLAKAAEDFGLETTKGEIDYRKHRDEGYIPTDEEIDYIHRDTEILADIMKYYYDNNMTSMTNATDAMKVYKSMIGKRAYDNFFPVLDKDTDDFIRRSYKGGFCYLNPKFKDKVLDRVYCYDVKSMYPSVMAYWDLPYGYPVQYNGLYKEDVVFPLFIQELEVCCDLKKGHIPSIQTKTFMSIRLNYLKSTEGRMINMVLTALDLERLFMDYDIYDIKFIKGYKFASSKKLFYDYVMKYYTLKEISVGAVKQLYKIFLNSLYGKFAMMMERQQATPLIENGKNRYIRDKLEIVDPMYTAVASYITASARYKLLDGIYKNIDNFIYCDTDSIHLTKPAKDLNLGKQLGQFNLEHGIYENNDLNKPKTFINMAKYLGQKCYILCETKENNGEIKNIQIKKIAGAPDKVKEQINFENFKYNFTSDADKYPKFRMKNVNGGVLLIPTTFTIKEKKERSIFGTEI